MKRLVAALFLSAACGRGLVDHNGVDLQTVLQCPAAQQACGSSCVSIDTDPNNCGGCGIGYACSAPQLATATCTARLCGFSCNPGFLPCRQGQACCPASSIAAGGDTSCAIVEGAVECWGSNDGGQLGTPPSGALWSATPVAVPNLASASSVAVGAHHACAILAGTGEVACWGLNAAGQLGDGTTTSHGAQKVVGLSGTASSLALGAQHSCAQTTAGLICWGANDVGQLGDGTIISHGPGAAVALPTPASSIAAGSYFTCAVAAASVYCWGTNADGEVPDSAYPLYSKVPALVSGVSNALSVGVGATHACAIGSGSKIWCWGADWFGQIGDGKQQSSSPVSGVSGLTAPSVVAGGVAHTCALSGGGLFCWGANSSGQLGLGGATPAALRPAALQGPTGVQQLAVGATHSCALAADNSVYCWGNNGMYQAGAPNGGSVTAPRPIGR
jgi:alpha-tubulin suppressor-like RCC1 family protein